MMDSIFGGTRGTIVYLDDVLTFGLLTREDDARLTQVLTRLQDAGLKFNREECIFLAQQLNFFGHELTPQGIRPCKDNMDAIMQASTPTDVTSLRSCKAC